MYLMFTLSHIVVVVSAIEFVSAFGVAISELCVV